MPVRNNPAVNESRGWKPVEPGHLGIVLAVRADKWNNPPLMDYVDVLLSVDGTSVRCGNYAGPTFEVVV
jgi:hypothetical protein